MNIFANLPLFPQAKERFLSDIERGIRSNLTIETLERIAGALGVKAKDLLK